MKNCVRIPVASATALVALLNVAPPAQAIDVYFMGTLVAPPPCVINSNQDINVDFGNDLLVGRVDGVNYEKAINYTLDCSVGASVTSAFKLQLQGSGAGFDSSVLNTSKSDLGLELRSGGVKLPVNTWINFNEPARPALTAVPVKNSVGTLTGGVFTASATLLVDYQ